MPGREYDPTLQSPPERRSLLSQGILRLRRLFVQVANVVTLRTDTITERTPDAGVTADGVIFKDREILLENADASQGVTLKQASGAADQLLVRDQTDSAFAGFNSLFGIYETYARAAELQLPIQTELTISSGAITVTGTNHFLDTESDDPSDNLDTINGASDGMVIILHPIHDDRSIVIKHDADNISCVGQQDITLANVEDFAIGIYDVIASKWFILGRTDGVEVIGFVIDGGGSEITTGIKGDSPPIPFACTINQVTLLADQSGSIQVDIWKDTYANFPPTNDDSITDAGTTPVISGATKYQDSTLTSWTTSIAAGEILRYNVDSVTTIERVTVALKVTRT